MTTRNDGGPAFSGGLRWSTTDPWNITREYVKAPRHAGMSLRDWFAGQAGEDDVRFWLNAMAANGATVTREEAKYIYADRMLAAREREAGR